MKKALFFTLCLIAQTIAAQTPWKLTMSNEELGIQLCIDLYEECIEVPGMSMFGPMNGYLNGKGIYGVWMVTSYKILSDRKAEMHLSNDLGSETQTVELTLQKDSTYLFEQVDGNVIKKAVNRKLVKVPQKFTLTPQS